MPTNQSTKKRVSGKASKKSRFLGDISQMCLPTPGFLWDLGKRKVKFGPKKAIFGVILGGLGLHWESATPSTLIWERSPPKKGFFLDAFLNLWCVNVIFDIHEPPCTLGITIFTHAAPICERDMIIALIVVVFFITNGWVQWTERRNVKKELEFYLQNPLGFWTVVVLTK